MKRIHRFLLIMLTVLCLRQIANYSAGPPIETAVLSLAIALFAVFFIAIPGPME